MITLHYYKSGEIIIKENDFGESTYLIKEGLVRVTKVLLVGRTEPTN